VVGAFNGGNKHNTEPDFSNSFHNSVVELSCRQTKVIAHELTHATPIKC